MRLLLDVIVFVLLIGLMVCVYMLIKNKNTCTKRLVIIDAVSAYHTDCLISNRRCDWDLWDYIETYDETLYRWWDWGYTRILPPDKFELIKDYIKEK